MPQVTEVELGWLAGIIDGEGTVYFKKRKDRKTAFTYAIYIYNSDDSILAEILSILKRLEIKFNFNLVSRKGIKTNVNHNKDVWRFQITQAYQCIKLLKIILPYIISSGRKARGYDILNYIPNNKRLDGKKMNYKKNPLKIVRG